MESVHKYAVGCKHNDGRCLFSLLRILSYARPDKWKCSGLADVRCRSLLSAHGRLLARQQLWYETLEPELVRVWRQGRRAPLHEELFVLFFLSQNTTNSSSTENSPGFDSPLEDRVLWKRTEVADASSRRPVVCSLATHRPPSYYLPALRPQRCSLSPPFLAFAKDALVYIIIRMNGCLYIRVFKFMFTHDLPEETTPPQTYATSLLASVLFWFVAGWAWLFFFLLPMDIAHIRCGLFWPTLWTYVALASFVSTDNGPYDMRRRTFPRQVMRL